MDYRKTSFQRLILDALKEDIGRKDITTELLAPKIKRVKAVLRAKDNFVVCGLDIARLVFKALDKNASFKSVVCDGQYVKKGYVVADIEGKTQAVLAAERTALNFLSLLSGIATKTKKFVEAVKPYKVKIMDTRKTIPLLRGLEKYAVKIGGGYNHRFSLDEMIMIKDNHLKVIGYRLWVMGLKEIKKKILPNIKIEVEVETIEEFKKALDMNPDIIMLDNMSISAIKNAVLLSRELKLPAEKRRTGKNRKLLLEASGGITLKNVRQIAKTGVDIISIGELTHSVDSVDISLEIL